MPYKIDGLNAIEVSPPVDEELEHFYECETCGQAVDSRRLGDVFHYGRPEHAPRGALAV